MVHDEEVHVKKTVMKKMKLLKWKNENQNEGNHSYECKYIASVDNAYCSFYLSLIAG